MSGFTLPAGREAYLNFLEAITDNRALLESGGNLADLCVRSSEQTCLTSTGAYVRIPPCDGCQNLRYPWDTRKVRTSWKPRQTYRVSPFC